MPASFPPVLVEQVELYAEAANAPPAAPPPVVDVVELVQTGLYLRCRLVAWDATAGARAGGDAVQARVRAGERWRTATGRVLQYVRACEQSGQRLDGAYALHTALRDTLEDLLMGPGAGPGPLGPSV